MVKKKIEVKKEENTIFGMKKNTALTIGALLVVVVLLNNYGVLTGEVSKGQVFPANLHTLVTKDWVGSAGTHQVEVIGIQEDANAIVVSIDGGESKTVWYTGCATNNEGIFVGNGRYNSEGIPEGVTIKVCSVAANNANVILIPET